MLRRRTHLLYALPPVHGIVPTKEERTRNPPLRLPGVYRAITVVDRWAPFAHGGSSRPKSERTEQKGADIRDVHILWTGHNLPMVRAQTETGIDPVNVQAPREVSIHWGTAVHNAEGNHAEASGEPKAVMLRARECEGSVSKGPPGRECRTVPWVVGWSSVPPKDESEFAKAARCKNEGCKTKWGSIPEGCICAACLSGDGVRTKRRRAGK
ncbi:hypothetical protein B0H19DRAFT_1322862 [Mycena capillaripes]|nr:hypothetical protein B0H19DRAFT_1322862 [Mycena capillaripes]